jgi:hypothetical protein
MPGGPSGLVVQPPREVVSRGRHVSEAPPPRARSRTALVLAVAGASYLLIGFVLWWHAWSAGASTHTLCGCGDPALFLWFFQWPATALAHLHNPLFSTALFHPQGVNLLAQTSVLGVTVPLIPVTWIFGPVAALNVASTLIPALGAFTAFVVLRRWVRWDPAAYAGGLLFGFSPLVLSNLEFAHFMDSALMVLPLILAVLDEICFRHRHDPRRAGLLLGLLLCWQFFLSTELLVIVVLLMAIFLIGLLVVALVAGDRASLRAAFTGLAVAAIFSGMVLAYPVWFALDGPAHLSGLIWPRVAIVGGFTGSGFVTPHFIHHARTFYALGGYEGAQLPSAAYLGWGLVAVVVLGSLIWFRDRRLWLFGLLLGVCVGCSIGKKPGQWEPSHVFARIPLLDQVIEQRFMVVGFLAAAAMLAIIVDNARTALTGRSALGGLVGFGVIAAALVPIAVTFAPDLPFTMEAVVLPRWYSTVAPKLPLGRVVLSYPAPFSGIQVSMAWQAVDVMAYSQAGGGGPEGVPNRAGSARAGFVNLAHLAFGINVPQPTGTSAELAAVRHALAVWQVNTVVISPVAGYSSRMQGSDPTYAAAFMTAVLGRLPRIDAGAWVWDTVGGAPAAPVARGQIAACVAEDEKVVAPTHASLQVARCMLATPA